jgi:hypothetical protein
MTLRNAVVLLALALAAAQASGQWSPAVNLSNSPNEWSVDACMDFDANGKVHIVYRDWWESTNRIYYIENVTGVWSARQLIATTSAAKPLLRITPDNVLHVFYKANSQLNYVFKSIGAANWSAPAKVNHDGSWCGDKACGDKWPAWAVVDASGGLFFSYIYLWDDNSSGPKSALWGRYKPLGGAWGPVELVEPGPNRDSWPAESQLVAPARVASGDRPAPSTATAARGASRSHRTVRWLPRGTRTSRSAISGSKSS